MNKFSDKSSKSIEVRSYSRPARIAFLVSNENIDINNWILDGIFYESYTRWGGARTLIIPFEKEETLNPNYLEWLKFFDPDFVYSYVDLKEALIEEIETLVMPIEMLRHKIYGQDISWGSYIPNWRHSFESVLSISTLFSPLSNISSEYGKLTPNRLVTQFSEVDENRFLSDNFGTSHDTTNYTFDGTGKFFKTFSLVRENHQDTTVAGDEQTSSLLDIFSEIAKRRIKTFLQLSTIHSNGINHPTQRPWDSNFSIFIGSSMKDRINFWNSRCLSPNDYQFTFNSLIVSPELVDDEDFCFQIGLFLNNNNFKREDGGSGPYNVNIYSQCLDKDSCAEVASKINKHTWNSIVVPDNYHSDVIPEVSKRLSYVSNGEKGKTYKVNDQSNELKVKEPEHFRYSPQDFSMSRKGQWLCELYIERYENESINQYNFNCWVLPKLHSVAKAFTTNQSKISNMSNLTVLTSSNDFINHQYTQEIIRKIKLSLLSDEDVFRAIIVNNPLLEYNDMRECLNRSNKYERIKISDKGQKHRGIISHFDGAVADASCLTNRFWRNVIRKSWQPMKVHVEDESKRPYHLVDKIYTKEKLVSLLSNLFTSDERSDYMQWMQLEDASNVIPYLKASLSDSMSDLVHRNVLLQIYVWNCKYCGNKNKRSLDTIGLENSCDICSTANKTPIDFQWHYQIAPFVINALARDNGLTVLWAINYLVEKSRSRNQIYLPEFELYDSFDSRKPKNELDIIALIDGSLVIAEVKFSASEFVKSDREQGKFLEEVERIKPNIAYLIFESICFDNERQFETALKYHLARCIVKLKNTILSSVELRIVIAESESKFTNIPDKIGQNGQQVHDFYERLE